MAGIVFYFLSLIVLFLPFVVHYEHKDPYEVYKENYAYSGVEENVVIQVFGSGNVRCIDHRISRTGEEEKVDNWNLNDPYFEVDFPDWLNLHSIDMWPNVKFQTSKDVEDPDVKKVLIAINSVRRLDYSIESDLDEAFFEEKVE